MINWFCEDCEQKLLSNKFKGAKPILIGTQEDSYYVGDCYSCWFKSDYSNKKVKKLNWQKVEFSRLSRRR